MWTRKCAHGRILHGGALALLPIVYCYRSGTGLSRVLIIHSCLFWYILCSKCISYLCQKHNDDLISNFNLDQEKFHRWLVKYLLTARYREEMQWRNVKINYISINHKNVFLLWLLLILKFTPLASYKYLNCIFHFLLNCIKFSYIKWLKFN